MRVVSPGSTRTWIDPPRPPSPPSGPPRGTCASRRKLTAPSPPSPARTHIFTWSRNMLPDSRTERRRSGPGQSAFADVRPHSAARRRRPGESLQVVERFALAAAVPDRPDPDREVEVGAGGTTRRPDAADLLPPPDVAAGADEYGREMVVGRGHPVAVVDPDLVAAAVVAPARPDAFPVGGRPDARGGGAGRAAARAGDRRGLGGGDRLALPARDHQLHADDERVRGKPVELPDSRHSALRGRGDRFERFAFLDGPEDPRNRRDGDILG